VHPIGIAPLSAEQHGHTEWEACHGARCHSLWPDCNSRDRSPGARRSAAFVATSIVPLTWNDIRPGQPSAAAAACVMPRCVAFLFDDLFPGARPCTSSDIRRSCSRARC
jgi:hypothetical protein